MSAHNAEKARRAHLCGEVVGLLRANGMSDPDACETTAVLDPLLARLAAAEAMLREGLDDESLEATGVMERALNALRESPSRGSDV